jgi:hypothetical protein
VLLCTGPSKAAATAGSAGRVVSDLIAAAESSDDAAQQQPWQQQLAKDDIKHHPGVILEQQQQGRVYAHEYHLNPAENGSYPSRQHLHAALWQDMAISRSLASDPASNSQQPDAAAAAAAVAAAADAAHTAPFGWVPDELCSSGQSTAADAAVRVRPKTAQIRSRTATSMPLEYFDSPEMEQGDLQQRLFEAQAAGAAGLQALSRFYDPQGAFIWAACMVLQYYR